ncbi:uncharacterized protein BDZ99DRAFT_475326 [Mytilinidion resinicola]|uniref:C2H2-type domain-containing protein n=1 Tax=Mytilinidion resinicola TaxID=574789 RepID=A0A6A6YTC4_9PEZI|nr:uncharacterized protein BDZ99DRAFT_475326 [Mytilinidion resinicola]KAF2811818.1 hypothetical protein BDZ99DRAFT_475326 [Mytilinidion resinicola]
MPNDYQPLPRGKSVPTYNVKILAGTSLHTPTKYLQKHLPTVSRPAVPSRVSSSLNSQLNTKTMPSEKKITPRGSSRKPRKSKSTNNLSVLSGTTPPVIPSSPTTKDQAEEFERILKRMKTSNTLVSVGDIRRALASRVSSEDVEHSDTTEKDKPYGCTVCGKRYTSSYGLENHLSRTPDCINGPQERFHCKLCGKHYKNPEGLKAHHKTAPNCNTGPPVLLDNSAGRKRGEPHRCEICAKVFASSIGLRYHRQFAVTKCNSRKAAGLAVKSKKAKSYRCGSCGKSYKNSKGLKYHLKDAAVKCTMPTTIPPHFEPGAFPLAIPEHSTYLKNAFRDLTTKTGLEQKQAMAGVQYCLDSLDVKIQRVWGGLIKKAEEYGTGNGAEEDKENDPWEDVVSVDDTGDSSDTEAYDTGIWAQERSENEMEDVDGVDEMEVYTNTKAGGDNEEKAEESTSPTDMLPHWATPRGIFNTLGTIGRKGTSDQAVTHPISERDNLDARAAAMHPASRWRIYGGPITIHDPLLRRINKEGQMSSKKRKRSDVIDTDSPASKRIDAAASVSPTRKILHTTVNPERPSATLEEGLASFVKHTAVETIDLGIESEGEGPANSAIPDTEAPLPPTGSKTRDSSSREYDGSARTPWSLPGQMDFSPMPGTISGLVAGMDEAQKVEFWQD